MALAAIVEGSDLVKLILASLAAGVGVTAAMSVAIFALAGFDGMRRDGRSAAAVVFALLGLIALAAVAGAIVEGIVIMTQK
jgi:hypothetical protein